MSDQNQSSLPAISVSALVAELRGLLEMEYPEVWVAGEICDYYCSARGHWYFTLRDEVAQIKAVMFRGSNLRCRFTPQDGLAVLARGYPTVYEPRGEMQLQVLELVPKGIGAAELALRQLIEKLQRRGYFDPARKRPLPAFPRRIGVVASLQGAAIRDILELLEQRWPLTEVIVRHSSVQGEEAPHELAAALRLLNTLHLAGGLLLDAIILARGGGSSDDLSAFNHEIVAEAIFQSVVPVISAVGHETDVTIADRVADCRAETPSAAVMKLVPDRREFGMRLHQLNNRLHESIRRIMNDRRQLVRNLRNRGALRRPHQLVRQHQQRCHELGERLRRAVERRLQASRTHWEAVAMRLEALSPLKVLQRGYSLTFDSRGRLLHSAAEVAVGEQIYNRLHQGSLLCRVVQTVADRVADEQTDGVTAEVPPEVVVPQKTAQTAAPPPMASG